jgi:hypothetical protein
MENIPYIETGTYLFRFMDPRGQYFWPSITNMLSQNILVLNSRRNFNDPFDSQPIIDNDLSNSAIRDYFRNMLEEPFHPRRSLAGAFRILELKTSGKTNLNKKHVENNKSRTSQKRQGNFGPRGAYYRFPLLRKIRSYGGHYAASFSGLCAVFRRGQSLNSGLSVCAEIVYADTRPHLPLSLIQEMTKRRMANEPHDNLANRIFFLSFLHKSSHWAYEHEARIFHPFHAFKTLPFERSELVGFILGPNSSREFETKLRDEIRTRNPSVSLDRSVLSHSEYRIIIPHKFICHRDAA